MYKTFIRCLWPPPPSHHVILKHCRCSGRGESGRHLSSSKLALYLSSLLLNAHILPFNWWGSFHLVYYRLSDLKTETLSYTSLYLLHCTMCILTSARFSWRQISEVKVYKYFFFSHLLWKYLGPQVLRYQNFIAAIYGRPLLVRCFNWF